MPLIEIVDKKNRLGLASRACDACRRRKVKCDQEVSTGDGCQRCLTISIPCTWNDEVKKRGRKRRVDDMSTRLKTLEKAFAQAMAAGKPALNADSSSVDGQDPPPPTEAYEDDESELEIISLVDRIHMLEVRSVGVGGRFSFGASSGIHLANHVLDFAKTGKAVDHPNWRPDPWEEEEALKGRMEVRNFSFPPNDLLPKLAQAYFDNVNYFAPLLHRPTFDELVENGTHLFEPSFAAVLLLVCANGARFVDDPRVCLPNQSRRSAGWGYYTQTEITRPDLLAPPTLFRIQAYLLAALYLGRIFDLRGLHNLLGIALRVMEELGLGSKKVYSAQPNANDELFKRCFWIAQHMEVTLASESGRPCPFSDDEFDLDLPFDCDDEYWNAEDPAQSFHQPLDTPSILAYFNHMSMLKKTHMKCLRTMFSIHSDPRRRKDALVGIESALNRWLEETPTHLKWGVAQQKRIQDDIFFQQAARLRLEYDVFLLVIYRPTVRWNKRTPDSEKALGICYQAARDISNVCDLVQNSLSVTSALLCLIAAYNASILLLLKLLDARRCGDEAEIRSILGDVENCMNALGTAAPLSRHADALSRRLFRLASRGNLALSSSSDPQNDAGMQRQDSSAVQEPWSLKSVSNSESSGSPAVVSFVPQSSSSWSKEGPVLPTQHQTQFLGANTLPSTSAIGWQGLPGQQFEAGSLPAYANEADMEWANTLLMEFSRTTSTDGEMSMNSWNIFSEPQG